MRLIVDCEHQKKHMWCEHTREYTDLDAILAAVQEAIAAREVAGREGR